MKTKTFTSKISGSLLPVFLLFFVTSAFGQVEHFVDVTNNVFTPAEITINVGDKVTWTNSEGWHNVNGDQSVFSSNPESFGNATGTGWTFSHQFNIAGLYEYQCDPHVNFGMFGKVFVEGAYDTLTIEFMGMTPHVGQDMYLRIEEVESGEEVFRIMGVVEENFTVEAAVLVSGSSYLIEFFADHNGNGSYDDTPVDHAWELELNEVNGNSLLEFTHNTDFTDIEWEHAAIVNLSMMGPHVDQEMYFALIEKNSGEIIDRQSVIVEEEFTVQLDELIPGMDYHVDFFADHNDNGHYDAPSGDHAWRVEILDATGDEIIDFSHNTDFTDIEWMHRLKVMFEGMTPHVGQMLMLYLRDTTSNMKVDSVLLSEILEADFKIESYAIEVGKAYYVDIFADHNGNGVYDTPPTDHAWRLETGEVLGDVELLFTHNTDFTDIEEKNDNTSVDIIENSVGFRAYPNPVIDKVIFTARQQMDQLTIYSASGKLIRSIENINSNEAEISMEELESGVYYVNSIMIDGSRESIALIRK